MLPEAAARALAEVDRWQRQVIALAFEWHVSALQQIVAGAGVTMLPD